jgi:hypothetical protein
MGKSQVKNASTPIWRRTPVLLLIGAGAICLCSFVLFFVIGSNRVTSAEGTSRPLVLIHAPDNGAQVVVGDFITIHAVARDEENIVRVEFWVDEQLEDVETSNLEGGITPFPFLVDWQPEATGTYLLTVRAFNSIGGRAHSSIQVEVVASADGDGDGLDDELDACPESAGPASEDGCPIPGDADGDEILDADDACPDVPGLAEVDGCPDRDGDGVPDDLDEAPDEPGPAETGGAPDADGDGVSDDEDLSPEEPGPAESGGAPDTGAGDRDDDGAPDDVDPCPDDSGTPEDGFCPPPLEDPGPFGEGSMFEMIPGLLGSVGGIPVSLEIEAYEFSVSREFNHVWCYVQLNDEIAERFEFDPLGENFWNIGEELAGENSVILPTSIDDPLEVFIDCWADTLFFFREEGEDGIGDAGASGTVYDLGSFREEYTSESWGGGEQIAFGTGPDGESFWARFRICGPSCDDAPIQAPILDPPTFGPRGEGPYMIRWRWDGNEDTIEGFTLSVNGTYADLSVSGIDPEARSADIGSFLPSCGEVLEFRIRAYGSDWRSSTSWFTPYSNTQVWDGETCPRTVLVSFLSFETGGLGSEQGPIKGTFWANDETLIARYRSGPPSFDATDDTERYLRPGNYYPIITLFRDIEAEAWSCIGSGCTRNYAPDVNYLEVDLGPRETLTFGATISEPGSYGSVFEAEISIPPGEIVPGFYGVSDNGIVLTASVDVLVGPEAGNKPDLIVQEVEAEDEEGEPLDSPQIRVFNNAADLVDEEVVIEIVQMQTGELLHRISRTMTIPSGASSLIPLPDDLEPYDLRLTIDPENTIDESDEGEYNNIYETPVKMRVSFVELASTGRPCESAVATHVEFRFRVRVGHRPPGGAVVWVFSRNYPWTGTVDYDFSEGLTSESWDLRGDPYYTYEFTMPAEDSLVVWADGWEDDPGLAADDYCGNVLEEFSREVNYGHSDESYRERSSGYLSCPDSTVGWGGPDEGMEVEWEITRIN